jgi:hypothetical protein
MSMAIGKISTADAQTNDHVASATNQIAPTFFVEAEWIGKPKPTTAFAARKGGLQRYAIGQSWDQLGQVLA